MNGKKERYQEAALTLGTVSLFAAMVWVLWAYVPRREVRFVLLAGCARWQSFPAGSARYWTV